MLSAAIIFGCVTFAAFQAAPTLNNPDFEEGLTGWNAKGNVRVDEKLPRAGKRSVVLGPGKGALRQKYVVPGLRILYFGATIKHNASDVKPLLRLQCYDAHGRQLMNQTSSPDAKNQAGIYLKTQAHTSYVVLSIESDSTTGSAEVDSVVLQDDDKSRVDHAPEVDLDEYMHPIWSGEKVLNESILCFSQNGAPAVGHLLYKPDRIVSVRDHQLRTSFTEGADYRVEGKTIEALANTNMPTMSESEIPKGEFPWKDLTPKHVFVTYTHHDRWTGPTPKYSGDRLPRTMKLLTAHKPLTVVAYGDSITLGINVSGFRNEPPYMPPWPDLFARSLAKAFKNDKVKLFNTALGGMTSEWGKDNAKDALAALRPDLVLIQFGMNDFWSLNPPQFIQNIESIMTTIRQKNPNTEFVLITTIKFDPAYTTDPTYTGHLAGYAEELRKLSTTGVAVFDMTEMSDALYKAKSAKDLEADPMHPDDFLARWYAQGLLAMFVRA